MGPRRLERGPAGEGNDTGALLMHRLRLDGFYYVESCFGPGMIGTRSLYWQGGEARFNIQSGLETRVQVTDPAGEVIEGYRYADCQPFTGDALDWTPRWTGGRGLTSFTGQAIRLEIEMNNARIYAIRGDFLPLSGRELRTFMDRGEKPIPRPGF